MLCGMGWRACVCACVRACACACVGVIVFVCVCVRVCARALARARIQSLSLSLSLSHTHSHSRHSFKSHTVWYSVRPSTHTSRITKSHHLGREGREAPSTDTMLPCLFSVVPNSRDPAIIDHLLLKIAPVTFSLYFAGLQNSSDTCDRDWYNKEQEQASTMITS